MSIDALAALGVVRTFLSADIVPVVPEASAGELRAAVKLLETAAIELADRHSSVRAESVDLIGLCARAATLLGLDTVSLEATAQGRRTQAEPSSPAMELLWADARSLTTTVVSRLQDQATASEQARCLLRQFYRCLGDHARSRLAWQSVFPAAGSNTGVEEPLKGGA
ncbi:hypothetical protein AWC05_20585 [Mycobacterium florentinum]|uniref:Uncharacterized protein n=1 Tax=Mycobacterium florentinum TaxID=292462 RepID=A0A1X1U8I9_MYCFL|nr:hypothetical protein [Mycobacterium florentinum]MCV7410624.1 hypothetical protein [Mycobacterium florentinum]ORV53141.1 hypothetical protein AWC05_20585 [Mycobacterium florentinum]BBX79948.1 hypothetical protein MFLOJ_37350 [Mycobacterium florentinum]